MRDDLTTLPVVAVTDGDRALVEWWARLTEDERENWSTQFGDDGFAKWLGSLRDQLSH